MERLRRLDAWIIGFHRWTATQTTTGACCRQSGPRTLLNQAALELGQRRKDVEDQFAASRRRVDSAVTDGLESNTALPEILDDIDQVAYRPPQPVKPPDDEGVAGLQMLKALVEAGTSGLRSANFIFKDVALRAPGFPQGVELKTQILFTGRDARVPDKPF